MPSFSVETERQSRATRLSFRTPNSELRTRAGATLTEVLIALMIMSIGIVSLAVIFPVSVLHTVKATQETNAADLRYNAEAIMDLYQNMIKNPVYFPYSVGMPNAALNADPALTQSYVIDPLGFAIIQQDVNTTIGATVNNLPYSNRPEHYFGNDSANNSVLLPIARYPLYWRSIAAASSIATLPDSWLLQYENFRYIPNPQPAADGVTQINITGLGNSLFAIPGGAAAQTTRAVIFSTDGQTSQVRLLTQVAGDTISWSEDLNNNGQLDPLEDVNNNGNLDLYPLPSSFASINGVPNIGNVRIETQDRRYTWLLTARQPLGTSGGMASVDVVVFFGREFEKISDDEALYPAVFTAGIQTVTVTYTAAQKPFMRKGGFIFDANNAYWYRITNVVDNNAGTAKVTIEIPAYANNSNGAFPARAMFPRHVVDVFPIGQKSYQ